MVTTVAKRIQSRLFRQGLKIALREIKSIYSQKVADANNPTEIEIDSIYEHFISLPVKTETTTIATPQSPQSSIELQHNQEAETLPQQEIEEELGVDAIAPLEEEETETSICVGGEIGNIVDAIAPTEESNQLIVSSADKQALVATQSVALGFELSEQETLEIADTIDNVFADYSAFLSGVTAGIKQYVDCQFDDIESELTNNSEDVRSHIANRTNRLNQQVEDFSINVKADIGGIRQNIKSSETKILSRFALPSK